MKRIYSKEDFMKFAAKTGTMTLISSGELGRKELSALFADGANGYDPRIFWMDDVKNGGCYEHYLLPDGSLMAIRAKGLGSDDANDVNVFRKTAEKETEGEGEKGKTFGGLLREMFAETRGQRKTAGKKETKYLVWGRDDSGDFSYRLPKSKAEEFYEKKIMEPGAFVYMGRSCLV